MSQQTKQNNDALSEEEKAEENEFLERLYKSIKKSEGGKCNVKHDKGGKTNCGIIETTLKNFKDKYVEEMKDFPSDPYLLSEEQIKAFYTIYYYKDSKAIQIKDKSVRMMFFDFCVNSGIIQATKQLQKLVGTVVDGKLGKRTVQKIEEYQGDLLMGFKNVRTQFYQEIIKKKPTQKKFEKGWLNRLQDIQQQANLERIIQKENQNIGGVELNGEFKEIKSIRGMKFDENSNLKFLLNDLTKISFIGVDIDDLALCLKVNYDISIRQKGIAFSLDPWEDTNPCSDYQRKVFYPYLNSSVFKNKQILIIIPLE